MYELFKLGIMYELFKSTIVSLKFQKNYTKTNKLEILNDNNIKTIIL